MHGSVILIVVLGGVAATASAQDASPQLDAVIRCRAEMAREARLACFDRAVAVLDRARDEKTVMVLDRRAVVARKQRRFGLGSAPDDTLGGGEVDRQAAVIDLDTTVKQAVPAPGMAGRWNLTLANGMVWQTLENLSRTPATGTAINVRRASLGGFRATIGKQSRDVPVKRLR